MNLRKLRHWIYRLEVIDGFIGVIGVCIVLASALVVQFFGHEEPCPLCLLQRVAFISVGLSFLLNVKCGNRAWHWAMAIISAACGAAVSVRQICLHLTDPVGFGSAFFGLHMYTWCFILFIAVILGSSIMLLIYPERNLQKISIQQDH